MIHYYEIVFFYFIRDNDQEWNQSEMSRKWEIERSRESHFYDEKYNWDWIERDKKKLSIEMIWRNLICIYHDIKSLLISVNLNQFYDNLYWFSINLLLIFIDFCQSQSLICSNHLISQFNHLFIIFSSKMIFFKTFRVDIYFKWYHE